MAIGQKNLQPKRLVLSITGVSAVLALLALIALLHIEHASGLVTAGSHVRTNQDGSVSEAVWAADDGGHLRILLVGSLDRGQVSPVQLRTHYPPTKDDDTGLWIHGAKTALHSGMNAYLVRNEIVKPLNLDSGQQRAVELQYRDWKEPEWTRFLHRVGAR